MQYMLYFWEERRDRGEYEDASVKWVQYRFKKVKYNKKGIIQFTLNGMCPLLESVFAKLFTYYLIYHQIKFCNNTFLQNLYIQQISKALGYGLSPVSSDHIYTQCIFIQH